MLPSPQEIKDWADGRKGKKSREIRGGDRVRLRKDVGYHLKGEAAVVEQVFGNSLTLIAGDSCYEAHVSDVRIIR